MPFEIEASHGDYESVSVPLVRLKNGVLVRFKVTRYLRDGTMDIDGFTRKGDWIRGQSLRFHKDNARALAHALQLLDAGPLGRLALQHEYDKSESGS